MKQIYLCPRHLYGCLLLLLLCCALGSKAQKSAYYLAQSNTTKITPSRFSAKLSGSNVVNKIIEGKVISEEGGIPIQKVNVQDGENMNIHLQTRMGYLELVYLKR